MQVESLDHLVLTVADVEASAAFFLRVVGMQRVGFWAGRVALHFGQQKINLHPAAAPLLPHAARPMPGCADLCFVTLSSLDHWIAHLTALDVAVEAGPVPRTGAQGPIQSVYLRDPDGNLIEIAHYGGQ